MNNYFTAQPETNNSAEVSFSYLTLFSFLGSTFKKVARTKKL